MGRTENGKYKADAGIELLQAVRARDQNIPFIIFSNSKGVQKFGDKARSLKASGITSSPTDLFAILNLDEAKKKV